MELALKLSYLLYEWMLKCSPFYTAGVRLLFQSMRAFLVVVKQIKMLQIAYIIIYTDLYTYIYILI